MPQETDESARTFSNQCRVAHKLMHECNGVAKFVGLRRQRERLACLLNLRRS
jgi:hypothetical protein